MGFDQAQIARWETKPRSASGEKSGRSTYQPSSEVLLRYADLLAEYGEKYESDCLWLLRQAKVTDKVLAIHDRVRSQSRPLLSKPGDVVQVPLVDSETLAETGDSVELPASLMPDDPAAVICLATSPDMGVPFTSPSCEGEIQVLAGETFPYGGHRLGQGLVAIDQSKTDLAKLRYQTLPVAVHYKNLQAANFSHSPFAFLRIKGQIDIKSGLSDIPHGYGIEERYREFTPEPERCDKAGVRLGWLTNYRRDDEGEAMQQCLLLHSAIVPGLWAGAALQITKWYHEPLPEAAWPQWELLSAGLHVLGQVVLWIPDLRGSAATQVGPNF